jgi:hypothetical protein
VGGATVPSDSVAAEYSVKDRILLNKSIKSIQAVPRHEFDQFSREQKIAFLINAYNVFFVAARLKSQHPKTFKQFEPKYKINIFFNSIDASDFVKTFLSPILADPAVLFALFCLNKKCPSLYGEALTADRLESQANQIAEKFLRDRTKNYYSAAHNSMILSPTVREFEYEILIKHRRVGNFVASYLFDDPKLLRLAKMGVIKVRYED